MSTHDNFPVPKHLRVNGSTPDLFMRCGVALCGGDPSWKEQLARLLRLTTDSVDAMAKGKSRVPPGVWREIAQIFEIREKIYPIMREAVIEAAGGPRDTRVYEFPKGFRLPVTAKDDGSFPFVEYTTGVNGNWRLGRWVVLPDDERVLPADAMAYRLRWEGEEAGAPFLVTGRWTARSSAQLADALLSSD